MTHIFQGFAGMTKGRRLGAIFVACVLVLHGLAPAQVAYADTSSGNTGDQKTSLAVQNVMICTDDGEVGDVATGAYDTLTITQRGGDIEFFAKLQWSDWSRTENANSYVTWSVSDSSIASITPDGRLVALDDGFVTVTCTLPATSAYSPGEALVATAQVKITGQTSAPYVTNIKIFVGRDQITTTEPYIKELADIEKSGEYLNLYAEITVKDPVTGDTSTYNTRNGLLSVQMKDKAQIADIEWSVNDTEYAYVEETMGVFRPIDYGAVHVIATWGRGTPYECEAKATICYTDPTHEATGYNPQDTLTIKAYYELYPPQDTSDPDDEMYVINITFNLEEIEAMSQDPQTYTVWYGAGKWGTYTAQGVLLGDLLGEANIDVNGVRTIEFGTADGYSTPVSWEQLCAERYYFPMAHDTSDRYADAVRVYPVVAYLASDIDKGIPEASYDMSIGKRFMLCFGGTDTGATTSNMQVYNINTLYIKLKGGPSTSDGDGDNDGDHSGDGGGTGEGDGGGSGDGDNSGDKPGGGGIVNPDDPSNPDEKDDSGTTDDNPSNYVPSDSGETAVATYTSASASASSSSQSGGTSSSYSIYQVMSNYDTVTNKLPYSNPFKALVVPGCILMVALGAATSWYWYTRQRRAVSR